MENNRKAAEEATKLAAMLFGQLQDILELMGVQTICAVYLVPYSDSKGCYGLYCTNETMNDSITQGVKTLLEIAHGEGTMKRV